MKIIFSPSKEMRESNIISGKNSYTDLIFENKTFKILERLKSLTKEEIASIMKIKEKLLETTYENIRNFNNLKAIPAISLYNGVAFKELEIEKYSKENLSYINETLYILSAFYGLVKPFTLLKKYRLDMTMKIFKNSLYEYWKEEINNYIKEELKSEILVNLASSEFSKIIDKKNIKNIINIDFKEYKEGKYISISSYSKQARGKLLNILVRNRISNIDELKDIQFNNYKLNNDLSDAETIIFSR